MLMTLCGGLIERSVKGGLIVVGTLNLGGSVEMILQLRRGAELDFVPRFRYEENMGFPSEKQE